jgi:hypothetical protein
LTKEEAQTIYRGAWEQYLLSTSEAQKEFLGDLMDSVQPDCDPTGRGEEWKRFKNSLPGFNDFWDSYSANVARLVRQSSSQMGKERAVN